MRKTLLAAPALVALALTGLPLLSPPAAAMPAIAPGAVQAALQADDIAPAREAGEAPRRENRRGDRRRAEVEETVESPILLVREAGSRGRHRHRP